METLIQGSAFSEVHAERRDLHERAGTHQHVENLVTLTYKVTLSREQTLRVREREEVSADDE